MNITTIAISLLLSATPNKQFLYGNCKPANDGFYKCLSSDEQIVYTNVLPTTEQKKLWSIAYAERQKARKQKLSAKPVDEIACSCDEPVNNDTVTDEPTPRPQTETASATKNSPDAQANEESDESFCNEYSSSVKGLVDRWNYLLQKWSGSDDKTSQEMDRIEKTIGELVTDECVKR